MTAPNPSPAEQALIDRFGIFEPEETLREALRAHHPIMRSETGPFSGCRCGQVKLGQDVIGHVTDHLRAALAPQADR